MTFVLLRSSHSAIGFVESVWKCQDSSLQELSLWLSEDVVSWKVRIWKHHAPLVSFGIKGQPPNLFLFREALEVQVHVVVTGAANVPMLQSLKYTQMRLWLWFNQPIDWYNAHYPSLSVSIYKKIIINILWLFNIAMENGPILADL
jgi:hypothetical protein